MYIEKIICFVVLLTAIYALFKKANCKILVSNILLTIPLLILNGILEGFRWQMAGVYLYIVVLVISAVQYLLKKDRKNYSTLLSRFAKFHIIYVVISLILVFLFPVNNIPQPSGKYKIGTLTYDLVDKNRKEIYGHRKGLPRKIRLQLYYPSDSLEGGEVVPWKEDGKVVAQAIPKLMGLPGFLFNHTLLINSNSYKGLALSNNKKRFPIVIISHGWTGFRNLHTDLAEMLASNGFVVVSIDHTYGSLATVFQNGEVVKYDPAALPNRAETPNYLDFANRLVKTYSLDSKIVIEHLFKIASGEIVDSLMSLDNSIEKEKLHLFKNRLNLEEIGALGHSTGGGAIVRFALKDKRIKAVFGMDPWIEPVKKNLLRNNLQMPAVFLRSEQWENEYNNENLEIISNYNKDNLYIYQINGSYHQSFSMLYMYNPLIEMLGFLGSLDSEKNAKIQQDYILQYFETIINDGNVGENMKVLENRYEEVFRVTDQFEVIK